MEKNFRESQLQKEIIALISNAASPINISQIARELGKHRSSVSRSVALLKKRDLIYENNRAYQVASEVAMIQSVLRDQEFARKMVETAKAMTAISIPKETLENAARAAAMVPFQDMAKSLAPLIESTIFEENIIQQYREISAKAFQSVDFSMLAATADLAKAASQITKMIPQIDVSPIFESVSFLTKHQDLLDDLARSCLPETISFYGSFLDEAVRFELPETRIENVSIPTSDIINSVSYSIIDEAHESPESLPSKPGLLDERSLDRLLEEIDPRFIDIRMAAWDTFKSRGRDKDRQACHSMRELLNQVIDELIPEELKLKMKKDERVSRRAKIRAIIGSDSEAELLEAQAKLHDAIYRRLSAISHSRTENEEMSVEFALASGQNTLAYLLFSIRKKDI